MIDEISSIKDNLWKLLVTFSYALVYLCLVIPLALASFIKWRKRKRKKDIAKSEHFIQSKVGTFPIHLFLVISWVFVLSSYWEQWVLKDYTAKASPLKTRKGSNDKTQTLANILKMLEFRKNWKLSKKLLCLESWFKNTTRLCLLTLPFVVCLIITFVTVSF